MTQPNQSIQQSDPHHMVQVCQNRTCLRSQSQEVLAAFCKYQSSDIQVSGSECLGQCGSGPTVKVSSDDTWYCQVRPEDVSEIVEQHLKQGKRLKRLLHPRFHPPENYWVRTPML